MRKIPLSKLRACVCAEYVAFVCASYSDKEKGKVSLLWPVWLNELSVLVCAKNNVCLANDRNIFVFDLTRNKSL